MAKNNMQAVGKWAFIIGVIIAILAALIALPSDIVTWVLVIAGLIVGFMNVSAKDATAFLVAAIALLIVGTAGLTIIPAVGGIIGMVLQNIVVFVSPAVLVVSLQAVYNLAAKP